MEDHKSSPLLFNVDLCIQPVVDELVVLFELDVVVEGVELGVRERLHLYHKLSLLLGLNFEKKKIENSARVR